MVLQELMGQVVVINLVTTPLKMLGDADEAAGVCPLEYRG
jgi:hypothetical protein